MIIDAVIQPKGENQQLEDHLHEVIAWCHQCFQLYDLEKSIDIEEFKRRLNVDNIDYNAILADNQEFIEVRAGTLYLQRVIEILNTAQ